MQQLLEKIQKSDQSNKKRLLIIMTVVSMIIIVGGWIFYMNTFVFNSPNEQTTAEVTTDFWPVFITGAKTAIKNTGSGIGNMISNIFSRLPKFGGENNMTVQNPQ